MSLREWAWVACAPIVYFGLLAFGRWLKRRWDVRLGVFYHLFCACAALFVPMPGLHAPEGLVRAFATAVSLLGTLFILSLTQRGVWELHLGQKRGATGVNRRSLQSRHLSIVVLVVLNVFAHSIALIVARYPRRHSVWPCRTLGNILAGLTLQKALSRRRLAHRR
jgi:hypothetical protein